MMNKRRRKNSVPTVHLTSFLMNKRRRKSPASPSSSLTRSLQNFTYGSQERMFGNNPNSTQAPSNVIINEELLDDDETVAPSQGTVGNEDQEAGSKSLKRKRTEDPQKKPLSSEVILGEGRKWKCKHCKSDFTGSYTRIHSHFFGRPFRSKQKVGIIRCKEMMKDRFKFTSLKERVEAQEKAGVSAELRNSFISNRENLKGVAKMKENFGMLERDAVNQSIMRFICANGIAFNVLRSPQFTEMVSAIHRAPKSYKGPSYEKARTTLLDECKRNVEKQLSPLKDTWHSQGISIVSDGWTNVKNQPLINVIAENSRGAMFMYGTDFSGVEKTGIAIADYLLKSIDEVGPSNVVQVITDNASNCKLAGSEIQKIHKHIFWSSCVVHTLNLVFKEFGDSLAWLKTTYKQGKTIVKFIVQHQHSLALFRSNSKLELLKVAKTRFATHYILLKRLLDCRESLVTTVCLNKWREWTKKLELPARNVGDGITELIKAESFWDEVERCLVVLTPMYKVLRFADGEGILMGEIYEKMDTMLGELKDVMDNHRYSNDFILMEEIILKRWEKMNIPLHCLGFALTPRFYDSLYLKSSAPGGLPRRPPNMDKEVVAGLLQAFEKIVENSRECSILRDQYSEFHMRKGTLFSTQAAHTDAVTMDPISWWSSYGAQTPELAEVAIKVLSQPISSSSAERSWSTYKYVHSVVRNRLHCSRAEKLVFIHSNLRLVSRFSKEYKSGDFKKWDIEPDNPTLEDSVVRLEEMTWDNLDQEEKDDDEEQGGQNE